MDDHSDLTAQARIRRAALALFAESGFDGTTVRAIANAAGVSPGLVIHHFGSKANLQKAVNTEVFDLISGLVDARFPSSDTVDDAFEAPEAAFRELFSTRPELGAYIRRLFFDGDDAGLQILRQFMLIARTLSGAFEDRGWMRIAPDSEMRDLQLIILEMGPVLFYPLLAAYFEQPPLDESIHNRWVASEFDLLIHGLFSDDAPRPTPREGKAH